MKVIELKKRGDGYHLVMDDENLGCVFDEIHARIICAFLQSILESGQIVSRAELAALKKENEKLRKELQTELNDKLATILGGDDGDEGN